MLWVPRLENHWIGLTSVSTTAVHRSIGKQVSLIPLAPQLLDPCYSSGFSLTQQSVKKSLLALSEQNCIRTDALQPLSNNTKRTPRWQNPALKILGMTVDSACAHTWTVTISVHRVWLHFDSINFVYFFIWQSPTLILSIHPVKIWVFSFNSVFMLHSLE